MPRRDVLLACSVAVLWGANFVAIHASLQHFPPLFLISLRFAVLALPALLFVRRPDVPVRWLLLYGTGFGIVQFVFLYAGLEAGIPAGLASLVLQASAPFTVLLAMIFLRERPGGVRLLGIAVALLGFGVIAVTRGLESQLVPVLLVLAGAFGWALGNIGSRQARAKDPFALMMWMTVVPPVPMLALALAVEGPQRIGDSLTTVTDPSALPALAGLVYTVVLGTVVGSWLWSSLMARHPSSRVAPFSMLVPVAGFASAAVVLGERPAAGDLVGGALVVAGVLLPVLVGRRPVVPRTPAHA